jgi:hypothetical protein
MEDILYSVNLLVHILAAIGCAAAPFYQLRMVKQRGAYGTDNVIHPLDDMIERILSAQPRLCLGFLVVLVATGVGFPVIDYAFHGNLTQVTHVDWIVGTMKTVLTFAGMGLVIHGIKVVDPRIQGLFRTFTPGVEPLAEDVARFWALRRSRKKHCQSCFAIALVILTITPVLRFF